MAGPGRVISYIENIHENKHYSFMDHALKIIIKRDEGYLSFRSKMRNVISTKLLLVRETIHKYSYIVITLLYSASVCDQLDIGANSSSSSKS